MTAVDQTGVVRIRSKIRIRSRRPALRLLHEGIQPFARDAYVVRSQAHLPGVGELAEQDPVDRANEVG
jgi:hypothetical protein